MIKFKMLNPRMTEEHLGFIPYWLSTNDVRPAKDQIDANYGHGGGWNPTSNFKFDPSTCALKYPGDPPMKPLAIAKLREETIMFYDHDFVLILQKDGSFEVARID